MLRALDTLARVVEGFNTRVGKAASWIYPLLVAIVVVNVGLRYIFSLGLIEFEEIQWHLYAAAFLLGYAWTYAEDGHVRVDVLSARFSPRTRAWIELLGCLFLLIPFIAIVFDSSTTFFWRSWSLKEGSDVPSGLPARYVIKLILSLALMMLLLQAVAVAIDKALFLIGYQRELR